MEGLKNRNEKETTRHSKTANGKKNASPDAKMKKLLKDGKKAMKLKMIA